MTNENTDQADFQSYTVEVDGKRVSLKELAEEARALGLRMLAINGNAIAMEFAPSPPPPKAAARPKAKPQAAAPAKAPAKPAAAAKAAAKPAKASGGKKK